MRILVTGATGSAGGWLAEALAARRGPNCSACPPPRLAGRVGAPGAARRAPPLRPVRPPAPSKPRLPRYPTSTNLSSRRLRPGRPVVRQAGRRLRAGNLTATRSLYDAAARWGGRPRILFVGSGLVYGEPAVPDESQDEDCPLRPNSPYAASKAAADLLSYQTAVMK